MINNIIESIVWPGSFIVILFLLSIFTFRRHSSRGIAIVLCVLAIFMYIVCSPILAIVLSQSLDYRYYPQLPPKNEKSAILVLGGGSSWNEDGKPFQPAIDTMERLYVAVKLTKEYPAYSTMILSGGDIFGRSNISGADVMKQACDVMGCTAKIILEGKSRNTDENFRYSSEILKQLQIKNVIVVTNNYHMERSMDLAKKYIPNNIRIYSYPSSGYNLQYAHFKFDMLIPNIDALKFSSIRLREYMGIIVANL